MMLLAPDKVQCSSDDGRSSTSLLDGVLHSLRGRSHDQFRFSINFEPSVFKKKACSAEEIEEVNAEIWNLMEFCLPVADSRRSGKSTWTPSRNGDWELYSPLWELRPTAHPLIVGNRVLKREWIPEWFEMKWEWFEMKWGPCTLVLWWRAQMRETDGWYQLIRCLPDCVEDGLNVFLSRQSDSSCMRGTVQSLMVHLSYQWAEPAAKSVSIEYYDGLNAFLSWQGDSSCMKEEPCCLWWLISVSTERSLNKSRIYWVLW